jgi:hypothetical protein
MTTNESPNTAPDMSHVIAILAEQDDLDAYALIAELKPHLTGPAHVALALAFDMCPIHDQDLDSCRDDASMRHDQIDAMYDVPLTACAHYWMRPND